MKDILSFCDKITVKKEPEKIVVHCGPNDLDHNGDPIDIVNDIEKIISKLQETFPGSQIIISTLLPRKESNLDGTIDVINQFITSLTKKFLLLTIKIYKNIHWLIINT